MQKSRVFLVIGIILILLFFVGAFLYFALFVPRDNSEWYSSQEQTGNLANPVSGLSTEMAVKEFNESFVFYLLYTIKAYNLHSPPLSRDQPRIQFFIDEEVYQASVESGIISVTRGDIANEDIIIRTTREEAVLMLKDIEYVKSSFSSGKSGIELVADKTTLFGKGYLNLYTELTGKSITGNVVSMYTS